MVNQESGPTEKLTTKNIGGVSVTLFRLHADDPQQKSYELRFKSDRDDHVAFVKDAIVSSLDDRGFNTKHNFDGRTLEFPSQSIGAMRLSPAVSAGNLLGSRAIYNAMQDLSQELPGAEQLDSAIRTKRSAAAVKEDQHAMRLKSKKTGELLTRDEIVDVIMDSLREHVATGDHITDPNITSEIWQAALEESADELLRRVIERMPVRNPLKFRQ